MRKIDNVPDRQKFKCQGQLPSADVRAVALDIDCLRSPSVGWLRSVMLPSNGYGRPRWSFKWNLPRSGQKKLTFWKNHLTSSKFSVTSQSFVAIVGFRITYSTQMTISNSIPDPARWLAAKIKCDADSPKRVSPPLQTY